MRDRFNERILHPQPMGGRAIKTLWDLRSGSVVLLIEQIRLSLDTRPEWSPFGREKPTHHTKGLCRSGPFDRCSC